MTSRACGLALLCTAVAVAAVSVGAATIELVPEDEGPTAVNFHGPSAEDPVFSISRSDDHQSLEIRCDGETLVTVNKDGEDRKRVAIPAGCARGQTVRSVRCSHSTPWSPHGGLVCVRCSTVAAASAIRVPLTNRSPLARARPRSVTMATRRCMLPNRRQAYL